MGYLILLMLIVIIAQDIYIGKLKKEICQRDGTYKSKDSFLHKLIKRFKER
jgi:hypothetical protein